MISKCNQTFLQRLFTLHLLNSKSCTGRCRYHQTGKTEKEFDRHKRKEFDQLGTWDTFPLSEEGSIRR